MLMPAAVLVVIILGAIAVDQAVVFTRQRELIAAAEAAANDAAGYGIDRDAFYRLNQVVFRLDRATEAAQAALEARGTAAAPTAPGSRCRSEPRCPTCSPRPSLARPIRPR